MNLLDLMVKVSVDDQASGQIGSLSDGIKGKLATAAKVGVTAVTAVTAATTAFSAACVSAIKDVADYGDNIDKMSQKMGLSAESYQEWDSVMRHSGTSMESMKASMKTLANAAESGNEAFERIGLSMEEVASMSQEELFEKTIAGLQNVEDTTERTYLAGQLLGRGATELGALLNMSAEETDEMRQRVHELGGVMSDEAVKAAAAFKDSLQDMQTAFDGLKNKMVSEFLPAATQVTDGLTEIFAGNIEEGSAMIDEGIDGIIDKATEMAPKILEIVGTIFGALIKSFIENIPKLVDMILGGIADMIKSFAEHTDEFIEAAGDFIMGIGTAIAEHGPEILLALGELLVNMIVSIGTHIGDIIVAGAELIGGLIEGIWQGITGIGEAIAGLLSEAIDAIGRWWSDFFEAGANLIQGLIDGFLSGVGRFLQAVSGTVEQADGTIQYVGQIYSPSRLLRKRGKQLMEGLSLGITDNLGMISDAMSRVSPMLEVDANMNLGMNRSARAIRNRQQVYAPNISVQVNARTDANPEEIAYASARRVRQVLAARGC